MVPPAAMHQSGPLRLIPYIRVSTAREVMFSPEQQMMKIEQYAEQERAELLEPVTDLNLSGRRFEKRQIPKIVERIRAGEADGVAVWRFSRFGRGRLKNLLYIAQVEEVGGRVLSATEAGNEDTRGGRLNRNLIMSVDEYQSEEIGDSWKLAHERRLHAGLPHTGRPRFGYKRCPDCKRNDRNDGYLYCETCKGVLIRNDAEDWALAEMYIRFGNGGSMTKLTQEMAARGVVGKEGAPITQTDWLLILDSGFGAGYIRHRTRESLKKGERGLKAEFVWERGAHEAVITEAQWQAYTARREDRRAMPPRSREVVHGYVGLVRCSGQRTDNGELCLSPMVSLPRQTKTPAYQLRCNVRHQLKLCDGRSVSAGIVDRAVFTWLVKNATGEETALGAMQAAAAAVQRTRSRAESIAARVTGLEGKLERLQDSWVEGSINRKYYDKKKPALESELSAAHAELQKALDAVDVLPLGPEAYRPLVEAWPDWTAEEKNFGLRFVIDHIIVVPGEGRKHSTVRVVGKGESYDYTLPTRATRAARSDASR